MENKIDYFNIDTVLSHNAVISMVVGHRGGGKTYSFLDWAIRDFLKNGREFVYCRRKVTELNSVKDTLFDQLADKYDVEVRVNGKDCYIRSRPTLDAEDAELSAKQLKAKYPWQRFGYFLAVSLQQNYKSANFEKVNKICYDEFISENGNYLDNEVSLFLNLFTTINRPVFDTRVVMMSNSGTLFNPFFMEYDIKASDFAKTQWIKRNKGKVICHNYINKHNEDILMNSSLGEVGTSKYLSYAVGNEFEDANDDFIVPKRPDDYQYKATLTDGEKMLNIYRCNYEDESFIWVEVQKNALPQNMVLFSVSPKKPIVNAPYHHQYLNILRERTHTNMVIYRTPEAKMLWYDFVKP